MFNSNGKFTMPNMVYKKFENLFLVTKYFTL